MKDIEIVNSMFSNKNIETDKLKITSVDIEDSYVIIRIKHWDYKWIDKTSSGSDSENQYYDFDKLGKELFSLKISQDFIDKHNLYTYVFHRTDKYESEILLQKIKSD